MLASDMMQNILSAICERKHSRSTHDDASPDRRNQKIKEMLNENDGDCILFFEEDPGVYIEAGNS